MAEPLAFRVHGMDCADEVAILRNAIGALVGAPDRLSFDILRGKMVVHADGTVDASAIARRVAETGMRAEPWKDATLDAAETSFWQRRHRTLLTALSGLFSLAAFLIHGATLGWIDALGAEGAGPARQVPPAVVALYIGGIVAGGWFVVPRAWAAACRMRPDMHLLMTIAVLGAAGIGEWFEAAAVTWLFAVSLALESWSVNRARRAVEALLAIAPPTARVISPDGGDRQTPAADVAMGSLIRVKPGDRFPLDGTVRAGLSLVNQAPITGESLPVEKAPGSDVFAGTVNGDGVLEVEVTKLVGETTLAQIIRMVEEAQGRRAPSERAIDRFAQLYTPAILGLAILTALVPPLATGTSFDVWFYRALVLLVIGCPCALVISTPVSIVASLAAAARAGVLVKGGSFIEAPARLLAVAMDKTGTLTAGTPEVADIVPLGEHAETELLRAMGALEAHNDHPLARAISAYVARRGIAVPVAQDVRALQGRGVTARVDGTQYWLGSHRYLAERGHDTPAIRAQIESMSSAGRTVVVVGAGDRVCGFVTLADSVRPESRDAIRKLHAVGIRRVVMLTGDNRPTAERIAAETGVDEVHAELLPADKVAAVEELVRQYGYVAMIGDGANDAPAMGRATVGIAMGVAGSDTAVEAADIALMSDDLARVPWLIAHSRRTLAVIHQNVSLSLGIKLLFFALALGGAAHLWAAIAADMGVSLIVIANALRLLKSAPERP